MEMKGRDAEIRTDESERRQVVLKDKKLAFFKKLIQSSDKRLNLVRDLARGFDLIGQLFRSGVFQNR